MSKVNIFVVIPAYNEEISLRSIITELKKEGYSIVVVDDGSTQKQSLFLKDLPVFCIRHFINLGQGAALQTGTSFSLKNNADYIVHFDADGQHNAAEINKMLLPLIDHQCDIVFGSRFLQSKSKPPRVRKMILQVARYINFLFTGLLLTDAHNGFRAMNRKAAEIIQLRENRMAHASEILFQVKKNHLRFSEVPVEIRYSGYSVKKGQPSWNSVRIVFDLLLHKLFE